MLPLVVTNVLLPIVTKDQEILVAKLCVLCSSFARLKYRLKLNSCTTIITTILAVVVNSIIYIFVRSKHNQYFSEKLLTTKIQSLAHNRILRRQSSNCSTCVTYWVSAFCLWFWSHRWHLFLSDYSFYVFTKICLVDSKYYKTNMLRIRWNITAVSQETKWLTD